MRLGPRGPQESAKRSGEWLGIVASGEWPVKRAEANGGVRKAQNEANWKRPLIICRQGVNIDRFGNAYAKRTQFRLAEGVTSRRWPCRKTAQDDRSALDIAATRSES